MGSEAQLQVCRDACTPSVTRCCTAAHAACTRSSWAVCSAPCPIVTWKQLAYHEQLAESISSRIVATGAPWRGVDVAGAAPPVQGCTRTGGRARAAVCAACRSTHRFVLRHRSTVRPAAAFRRSPGAPLREPPSSSTQQPASLLLQPLWASATPLPRPRPLAFPAAALQRQRRQNDPGPPGGCAAAEPTDRVRIPRAHMGSCTSKLDMCPQGVQAELLRPSPWPTQQL